MKNNGELDSGFFIVMLGFHGLGTGIFLFMMALSIMEIVTGISWWVCLLIAILSALFGYAWFRIGVEIDLLHKKIDELTEQKAKSSD